MIAVMWGRFLGTALLVAACYTPNPQDCAYRCGPNAACPSGQACNIERRCTSSASIRCLGDAGIDTVADAAFQDDPANCGMAGRVCSSGACVGGDCVRRVFVTKNATDGNLKGSMASGILGADAKCTAAGLQVSGTAVWKAWISGGTVNPIMPTRLTHSTAPYRRLDNAIVALDFNGLISGTLMNPISIAEDGTAVTGMLVWTQTSPMGTTISGAGCDTGGGVWSSNTAGVSATVGSTGLMIAGWSQSQTLNCASTAHLYCIEQ